MNEVPVMLLSAERLELAACWSMPSFRMSIPGHDAEKCLGEQGEKAVRGQQRMPSELFALADAAKPAG